MAEGSITRKIVIPHCMISKLQIRDSFKFMFVLKLKYLYLPVATSVQLITECDSLVMLENVFIFRSVLTWKNGKWKMPASNKINVKLTYSAIRNFEFETARTTNVRDYFCLITDNRIQRIQWYNMSGRSVKANRSLGKFPYRPDAVIVIISELENNKMM